MSNLTTENNTQKRSPRFYSREEMLALKPFIKGEMSPTPANLKQFCEKYNRPFTSVQVSIYSKRRANKSKKNMVKNAATPNVSLKRDTSVAKISKGEFKIPVNNWNMTNENGQLYFVVKF